MPTCSASAVNADGPFGWRPGAIDTIRTATDAGIHVFVVVNQSATVDEAHDEVTQLLTAHREQLGSLTEALLASETLDAPDAYAAAGVPMGEHEAEAAPAPA